MLVVCSYLLSPVSRWVSPGAPRPCRPSGVRDALPLVVLVLCLRVVSVRLPSFLSRLFLWCLCGLVVVLFLWVSYSTACVLAYSSGDGFPGVVCSVVCLQSHLHPRCHGSVFFLLLRLVRRLYPSVVFLSCLRDEVTLVWVECRLWFLPLGRNEGLVCWSRLYSFGMGSPFGSSVFCIHS